MAYTNIANDVYLHTKGNHYNNMMAYTNIANDVYLHTKDYHYDNMPMQYTVIFHG